MRKILLGTTAVAGAALMSIGAAQAQQAPTVRVGGYFEFSGAYIDDNYDRGSITGNAAGSRGKVDFRSDAEIHVLVSAKAANGLSYGANIEVQVDNVSGGSGANTGLDTDEFWGFVSSPTLGTLQFGDQDNAADQMKVTIPGVTALGMSVIWDDFVMPGADGNRYLLADINDGNDSTKIIYLSPQFFGFDFGVSFAPTAFEGEQHTSNGTLSQRDPQNGIKNELSGAIRYRGSFGNVGVAASFGAMRADAPDVAAGPKDQDVTQYQAGLNATAFGVTVGGFYSWGKFGGITRGTLDRGLGNSTNYGFGASYTLAGIQLGAFYANAERDGGAGARDREETMWGLGAVYGLAPGLEVFANYTNVEDKYTPVATPDRDIDIVIIGTRLAF
jgi:predicted porin